MITGSTIPGTKLQNIMPYSLKIWEEDNSDVHFHAFLCKPKTKLEEQNIFTCTHEGCVKTFCRAEELDQHLLVGDCHLKLEIERSNDLVIQKYPKILQEEKQEHYTLSCFSKERTGEIS